MSRVDRKIVVRFIGTERRIVPSQANTIDPLVDDRLPMHRVRRPQYYRDREESSARTCAQLDETRIYLAVSILNLFKYKLHTSM